MKLHALALDYDGTIAAHDAMVPGIREAIDCLRNQAVRVLLVTGRRLADLHRVAGDLRCFDVVVAENGSVVLFPDSGRVEVLGPAPVDALVQRMHAAGIPVQVGQCVVETDSVHGAQVLEAIQQLQLPLTLLFNRGRLMVLPQGISKATGLHAALRTLRLSEHNAIAVGDAENDHALLTACEVGVAVSWGSPALCAVADRVLQGSGPGAVVPFLQDLARDKRLEVPHPYRRRMHVGTSEDGRTVTLGIHGRNILIAGDARSGKSWLAGLLAEQRILNGYCVCVIDPEGDYLDLQSLPGTLVLGREMAPPRPREVADALRHPDISVVIDLCKQSAAARRAYVRGLLRLLTVLRRQTDLPHRILLDEAHYWLSDRDVDTLLDLDAAGYTFATYRVSQIPQWALARFSTIILTRTTIPAEVEAAAGLAGLSHADAEWTRLLGSLAMGEVLLLPGPETGLAHPLRVRLAPRVTSHVRHRHKYVDVPVADPLSFVFTRAGVPTGGRARTLSEFCAALEQCDIGVFGQHLCNGDFERWAADVYGDYALAAIVRDLAQSSRAKDVDALREGLIELIRSRYLIEDAAVRAA